MHELLGQKFAHAGAQHGAAIGTAAVGGWPAALELHLPAFALEYPFKHRESPAIPIAVAGAEGALLGVFGPVDRQGVARRPAEGPEGASRHTDVAREPAPEGLVVHQGIAQPQFAEEVWAMGHILRLRQRGGRHWHVVTGIHLACPVIVAVDAGGWVRPQRVQQGIVRPLGQGAEALDRPGGRWGLLACHG